MKVEIKDVPKMRVTYVRHVGPYDESKVAWDKLCHAQSLELGPTTQFIGVCYDDPKITPAEKIRYDACVTVDAVFKADGEVQVQEIAGCAIISHVGFTEMQNIRRQNDAGGLPC